MLMNKKCSQENPLPTHTHTKKNKKMIYKIILKNYFPFYMQISFHSISSLHVQFKSHLEISKELGYL